MTLRQYYRAALWFPLIPPAITWPLAYLVLRTHRGAADWVGAVAFVSLAGLIFYIPCALLFSVWEFRRPIPPKYFPLVLLTFPPACALLVLFAGMVLTLAVPGSGSLRDAMRTTSFFGTVIITVGYIYVGIIAGIASICRRHGYVSPEPSQE